MGFDKSTCNKKLKAEKLEPICYGTHCDAFQVTIVYHNKCYDHGKYYDPIPSLQCINRKGDVYLPVDTKGKPDFDSIPHACLKKMKDEPQAGWDVKTCYCCCSCMANGTPIAVPGKRIKLIEDFRRGDLVLVAEPKKVGREGLNLEWRSQEVVFSNGTGKDGHQPVMVYIHFGNKNEAIIVTVDQIFLMPDGKVKRADKLVPSKDSFVSADGQSLPINEIHFGEYKGGVHHIATSLEFDGKLDGHLLNAAGIVVGDYALQIYQKDLQKDNLVEGHDELPEVGTQAYLDTHKHLEMEGNIIRPKTRDKEHKPSLPHFKTLVHNPSRIPNEAAKFFNQERQMIIKDKASERLITNHAGSSTVQYLFKLLQGFYPKIDFSLDWANLDPNCYAFEQRGHKVVEISGALVRIDGLYMEGLALILGQALGAFYGNEGNGDVSTIQADFYSTGVLSRTIWYGDSWLPTTRAGIEQINKLFDVITAAEEKSSISGVAISCRQEAMTSGLAGGNVPTCDRPSTATLKVAGDEVGTTSEGKPFVILKFNEPLDVTSAENFDNYKATPTVERTSAEVVELTSAEVNEKEPSKVTLLGDFKSKTDYQVIISNVTSAEGTSLDPDHNYARFKTY